MKRKVCTCGFKFSKSSKVYWIEYYTPEGKRRRERIGPWRKLAEEVLAKCRVEIAENKFLDKVKMPKVLFKDFAKKYLKWCWGNNKHPQTKEYRVKLLSKHFVDKLISDIFSFDVEKYKLERKKEILPGTVNK